VENIIRDENTLAELPEETALVCQHGDFAVSRKMYGPSNRTYMNFMDDTHEGREGAPDTCFPAFVLTRADSQGV